MNVTISKDLAEAIGYKELKMYGLDKNEYQWRKGQQLYLPKFTAKQIARLAKLVEAHPGIRGVKTILKDCELWMKALGGDQKAKPRKVHPNAVTNALRRFTKDGWLSRMSSGLYRWEGEQ